MAFCFAEPPFSLKSQMCALLNSLEAINILLSVQAYVSAFFIFSSIFVSCFRFVARITRPWQPLVSIVMLRFVLFSSGETRAANFPFCAIYDFKRNTHKNEIKKENDGRENKREKKKIIFYRLRAHKISIFVNHRAGA